MGVPIISSNMTSVTTPMVAHKMSQRNMLACIPKNVEVDNAYYKGAIPSTGLEVDGDYEYGWLCIDVPNGYIQKVVDLVKEQRDWYQDRVRLIVGNVVTAEQTEALLLAGADIVKVGIGSGAACSTRIKTGVGMPQLSAVIECADAAHGLGGHIISDGGCVVAGDVVKAFAGGADFVMLGGMLAGHDENAETCSNCLGVGYKTANQLVTLMGGETIAVGTDQVSCSPCNGTGKIGAFYGMSSIRGNEELSGGLKDYRASEGWEIKLPNRGGIDNTLQDIEGGLRSACSYVGARNLKDLPKCATFVQVNRQANSSMWDNRI